MPVSVGLTTSCELQLVRENVSRSFGIVILRPADVNLSREDNDPTAEDDDPPSRIDELCRADDERRPEDNDSQRQINDLSREIDDLRLADNERRGADNELRRAFFIIRTRAIEARAYLTGVAWRYAYRRGIYL